MTDLKFDVIVSGASASGAALTKLADNIDKTGNAARKAEDAQIKLTTAEVKGQKAALQLGAAQAKLAKVTADSASTDQDKAKAQLAVDHAQLQVTKSSRDAARATQDLANATATGAKSTQLSGTLLVGLGTAAAAGAVALKKIISASMDFDKAMSGVAAVSDSSAQELMSLREAALNAGRDTAFSASQAAVAESELAKAGVSTADILGGALRGSLDLAAAGQLDLGESATIAAQAMNIFDLKGTDVAHIADVLAAGANKSAADVEQLGQAMQQGGLVASQLGISFDDTIAVLSAFADNALTGSDAGTSLKTMLLALAGPSSVSAEKMQELGINAFDASGQFVGLERLAGILQSRLGRLTDEQRNSALATIFGNDAVRSANVLYSIGEQGVADYAKAVDDTGAAGRNAGRQLDNLSGDLEALKGSIETALIKTGSAGNDVLRFLTKRASDAVNVFSDLPGPVQATGLGLLASGTAATAALAAFGVLVPKVREARTSLAGMGRAGELANIAVGKLGKALTIGTGVLASLAVAGSLVNKLMNAAAGAAPGVEQVKTELIELAKGTESAKLSADAVNLLAGQIKQLADPALGDRAAKTVLNVVTLGQADPSNLVEARQNIGSIDQALSSLVQSGNAEIAKQAFDKFAAAAQEGGVSLDQVRKVLPQYADALAGVNNENKLGTSASTEHKKAVAELSSQMKEQKTVADQLKDSIDALNGANLSAGETENQFTTSVISLKTAIHDNGKSLDLSTAKTDKQRTAIIANREAVFAAIRAAQAHATAVATQTNSVNEGNKVFADHIKKLRETLAAAGVLPAVIEQIIAKYAKVPAFKRTKFEVDKERAEKAAARIAAAIRGIPSNRRVSVEVSQNNTVQKVQREIDRIHGKDVVVSVRFGGGPGKGGAEARSTGGVVTGGVAGRDSVLSLLTPGERVLTVAQNRAFESGRLVGIGAVGGAVTVGPGALQLTINATGDSRDIERVVDRAFQRFADKLAVGQRR